MVGGIDGAILTGLVIVHQTETATDHGIADLADRQRTRHRARPAQPDQPVGSGEFVDGGAAVEPIQPVPEGQGLGVAEQVADRTFDHQPLAERAAVGANPRRPRRGAPHRPAGQQVPGTLAGFRMSGVLVVDGQLVAHRAGGDQLPSGCQLQQRVHRAAAGRVHPNPQVFVADAHTVGRLPAGGVRAGLENAIGAPAQRSDAVNAPAHGVPTVVDQGLTHRTGGVEHLGRRTHRLVEMDGDDIGSVVRQRVPHHHGSRRSGNGRRQHPQGSGPGHPAQFPGVTPARQQVQIDLVGLRAGDRVVVGTPGQLHPGLGQRGLRVPRPAQQRGEHSEPLGTQHRVLGSPVGLLGVDVGDVLTGVDRVHVAGLRRGHRTALVEFGAYRGEEVRRQRADESRPGVPGVPVAVNLGHPGIRRGVVGTDRQQHVAGQCHRLQFGE